MFFIYICGGFEGAGDFFVKSMAIVVAKGGIVGRGRNELGEAGSRRREAGGGRQEAGEAGGGRGRRDRQAEFWLN